MTGRRRGGVLGLPVVVQAQSHCPRGFVRSQRGRLLLGNG